MTDFQKFIENNQEELEQLFLILKSKIYTTLSFNDFCKFCYIKTYYSSL